MKMNLPKFLIALLSVSFAVDDLRAQLGEDNPTGPSGQFNGNVTTAGSFDPLTGNSTRTITELVVPNGVGAYPLAFTRTMNTRDLEDVDVRRREFGGAGTWRHNYQWSIQERVESSEDPDELPRGYEINYPDGRRVGFVPKPEDPYFRARDEGVGDRFQQLEPEGTNSCYLLLPDGGKVLFQATSVAEPPEDGQTLWRITYTFEFLGIFDPHGLFTSVTSARNGNGDLVTTTIIEPEPGGRRLTLFYTGEEPHTVLDRVEERASATAPARRTVKYNYVAYGSYTALDNVVYFGESSLTARYTYQASNDSVTRMALS
jgi:hypothetical protein